MVRLGLNALLGALLVSPLARAWGDYYVGALYTLDNNPTNNSVIVAAIGRDGSAEFASLVPTGGQGPGPTATDLISGQDGVVVAGQYLFAVNSGSNSITMFAIDMYDPTVLVQLGNATDSGGDFPVSIAVNPNCTMACVANGGANNNMQCFSLGLSGMMPIEGANFPFGVNQTTPPAGFTSVPGDALFSADGSMVYVSVKGAGAPGGFTGFLQAFSVDGMTVTKVGQYVPPGPTPLAFSLARFPNSNALLLLDPGSKGLEVVEFGADGNVTYSANYTIPGSAAACWVEYSDVTGSFYLADTGLGKLDVVSGTEKAVTFGAQYDYFSTQNTSAQAQLSDITIATFSSSQAYLYVLAEADLTIRSVSLTPQNATMMQTLQLGQDANKTGQIGTGASFQGLASYVKPAYAWNM